ncbi:CaiB/BaiF CoA transferase family protein [Microterricola pindariensis]|uniref:Carnitine dehydratase n=1 Tax=Microterricola pindariensis TaxID=478010 RepID=A0ABX5AZ79_9MICO|nr:CoA transferase [Microterricola pindariensis]PPL20233.1 hypothetical protein GY24_01420 [Microterricola pindariensis]
MNARSESQGSWLEAPASSGPLSGVRVLDFSRILAGPYATMHLADLGADVIKVEAPGRGDETRHWGPPYSSDGTASYFLAVNHNKRSIELDLANSEDAQIAYALAVQADIVVDNFLPGRMKRFGLDRETLAAANPQIVTATVSGFGRGNMYSERPGFDFLAQAMGGLMSITGQPGGEPTRVGVAITDLLAGVLCATGILAALSETRTGALGRHIEVSLLDTQISMLANIGSGWLVSESVPERFGNAHPSIAPYETLATADKPLAVAVGTDRQFRRFVETLGAPQLGTNPDYATNRDRVVNRAALVLELEALLVTNSRDHWLEHLIAADVPVAPVNTVAEALGDPVVRQRMIAVVNGIPQIRTAINVDGEALAIHTAPPKLGADSASIRDHLKSRTQGVMASFAAGTSR